MARPERLSAVIATALSSSKSTVRPPPSAGASAATAGAAHSPRLRLGSAPGGGGGLLLPRLVALRRPQRLARPPGLLRYHLGHGADQRIAVPLPALARRRGRTPAPGSAPWAVGPAPGPLTPLPRLPCSPGRRRSLPRHHPSHDHHCCPHAWPLSLCRGAVLARRCSPQSPAPGDGDGQHKESGRAAHKSTTALSCTRISYLMISDVF